MSATNLTLYRHPLSGHSHRVELLLSLLNLDANLITVDLMKGEHKSPDFLAKNPMGQVPVLHDENSNLADSNAILTYLATKYDTNRTWLPTDPLLAAQVQKYLSLASGPIASGPATARLITVFGAPFDAQKTIEASHKVLKSIDDHLRSTDWLVGNQPTIADLANYAYIAHAPEGNVDISSYRFIQSWLKQIEALDGFIGFQKTVIGLAA